MESLAEKKILLITGVKGGVGKSISTTLLTDFYCRYKRYNVALVNCDARVDTIEMAHEGINEIKIYQIPLVNNSAYSKINAQIEAHKQAGNDDVMLIDMPGQSEFNQIREFWEILDENDVTILWVMNNDRACMAAFWAAKEAGMPRPVPVIAGYEPEYMEAYLDSRTRLQYRLDESQELWIEPIADNILPHLKAGYSVADIIGKAERVTSIEARAMRHYMDRFAAKVEAVGVRNG